MGTEGGVVGIRISYKKVYMNQYFKMFEVYWEEGADKTQSALDTLWLGLESSLYERPSGVGCPFRSSLFRVSRV